MNLYDLPPDHPVWVCIRVGVWIAAPSAFWIFVWLLLS